MNNNLNVPNNMVPENIPKKKKIGINLIFIIIIIIIIVGLIYYFMNINKKGKESTNKETSSNNETIDIKRNGKKQIIYEITNKIDGNMNFSTADDIELLKNNNEYNKYEVKEIGVVTCKTDKCEIDTEIYKQYAIVAEENAIYLYDYKNDKLIAGPLAKIEKDQKDIVTSFIGMADNENNLHAVVISNEKTNKSTIYSLKYNKVIKNIEGSYVTGINDLGAFAKFDYVPLDNQKDEKIAFYNFKDEKIAFSISKEKSFEPLYDNQKGFIMTNSKLYDLNGQEILNGVNYDQITYKDGNFLLANVDGINFKVYDENSKLIRTSKTYKKVFLIDNYALIINNSNIQLVDADDNLITTFINDYTSSRYKIDMENSGWATKNDKTGVYVTIFDKNLTAKIVAQENPNLKGLIPNSPDIEFGYMYYYIPQNKELNKIAIFK